METQLNEKREALKKYLINLKHGMAKYFDCDDAQIKFSDSVYMEDKSKIKVELILINREITSLKKFNTSTYYFDFEVEYLKREGIWYEGNFYSYENLNEFFKKVFLDIENLK